jgi:pimeloyl-ACP methyl ester carboxylesterase
MHSVIPIGRFPRRAALANRSLTLADISAAILPLCLAMALFPTKIAAQNHGAGSTEHPMVARTLPLTRFYDTPDPLPPGKPGELIRSMPFDSYNLPLEVSAIRILYYSRSASGANVAASGVVLFPDRKPPKEGWPVIAWAHAINGVARQCAPSLARNLQHGPFLSMYVGLGYAVVATDYTGLGTNFRNAFVDATSNAFDIVDSVVAARRALPQLGSRWIAMGAGEGGMAAAALAEMDQDFLDSNYLGSIAISRLSDLHDIYGSPSSLSSNLPLLLAYGVKTVYPDFEVHDILSDRAFPAYEQIAQTCGGSQVAQENSAMLKPKWESNKFVQDYFNRNRVGLKKARVPLLVLSSEADPSIAETTKIIARLCGQGDQVQFVKYAESDPGKLIGDSVRDQISWIQARFAQAAPRSNCGQH